MVIHSFMNQNNFKVLRKWRKKFQFFLQVKSWKWPGQKGVWAVVFESPVACCWFNRVQWKPFRASLTAALASCVKSDYGKTIFTERNTNNNTDHDLKISQAKCSLEHLIKVSNWCIKINFTPGEKSWYVYLRRLVLINAQSQN